MYIRVNKADPHYVFIDKCEAKTVDKMNLKLKYYNDQMFEENKFLDLNCSQRISNENDLDEWKKVPLANGHFKCANVSSEFCQTYAVKASA
jgi:hypothetical protein